MTEEGFRSSTQYLVEKYISDAGISKKILKDIDLFGSSGAKEILSDICENSGDIEDSDGALIKDISFNFI
ncbi:MAG: hypothetical protein QM709_09930 [Spongiibacteraceae bacterium]